MVISITANFEIENSRDKCSKFTTWTDSGKKSRVAGHDWPQSQDSSGALRIYFNLCAVARTTSSIPL
jgi:hypothetical protein